MSQKLKLAEIVRCNEVFGVRIDVKFFTPQAGGVYKLIEKQGFKDQYAAEQFAFEQNTLLLRDRVIKWKDNLIYLTKYGYLHGKAKENAAYAYKTINQHLHEISRYNTSKEDIIKGLEVIAYAVRLSMPHPASDRYATYCKLADLLTAYFTLYNTVPC